MKEIITKLRYVPDGDNCPQGETSPKGITLITLVVTIAIMLIIAGVSISVGSDVIESARLTKFNTELKIIHTKVNEIVEEDPTQEELDDLGQTISDLSFTTQTKIEYAMQGASTEGFKYFSKNDLEAIGVADINREVIINFATREVVDINGVKKGDSYIYRLAGWNNVEYQNQNTEAPEFSLTKKVYGLTAAVQVPDIVYKGNVTKGEISYCLFNNETEGNWQTISGQEFNVEQSGIYKVRITDSAGNITDKTIEIVLANKPKLDSGMTPVIYDATLGKWKKVDENSGEWYDYASDKKQWANVMLQDGLVVNDDGTIDEANMGSMFVWIPRYMYQIPAENYNTSTAGEIQIKFLQETTNIATDGTNVVIANASGGDNWNIHPAFCDGTKNNFVNGEWDKDITGIWVAKFEASSSNNTTTNGGGNTTGLDVKVLPNVPSWRGININNIFDVCKKMSNESNIYELSSNSDTHMMKNSEWGAVAYLSQSKYGINGQIWNNADSSYITGKVAGTANAGGTDTLQCESYNEGNGPNGSSTGTVYGIYDMSGGSHEKTAAYINNSNAQDSTLINKLRDAESKYKQVYNVAIEESEQTNYQQNASVYGDALYETSLLATGVNSWNSDNSSFPSVANFGFNRSGRNSIAHAAGAFNFGGDSSNASSLTSFRPVCIVE